MNAYQAAVKMIPFSQILPYSHCETTVFLITVIVWNVFFPVILHNRAYVSSSSNTPVVLPSPPLLHFLNLQTIPCSAAELWS